MDQSTQRAQGISDDSEYPYTIRCVGLQWNFCNFYVANLLLVLMLSSFPDHWIGYNWEFNPADQCNFQLTGLFGVPGVSRAAHLFSCSDGSRIKRILPNESTACLEVTWLKAKN
jgi:hypothetical protein